MIQIGAPVAHDFGNPLGVLSDCHRRVEHFLRMMITVAEQARGGALAEEQRDALEVALRYFVEAAPKHTADEEESLFPQLRMSSAVPSCLSGPLDTTSAPSGLLVPGQVNNTS